MMPHDRVAPRGRRGHDRLMILGDELRRGERSGPRPEVDLPDAGAELRTMALHLETAAVLDGKAAQTSDPVQQATLRRRADQRRRQAARIRARLAAGGRAVPTA